MNDLNPLLRTTLVLVAHPDDEAVACGGLMQRMQRAIVVFATDGAPRSEAFWKQYGSRQAYASVRREEAKNVLGSIGACPTFLADRIEGGVADQELFRNLPVAIARVEQIVSRVQPDCILTLAYEGGHPDHDACCFVSSMVGRRANVPVWESPLYHRKSDGAVVVQAFAKLTGAEREWRADSASRENSREKEKKIAMFQTYKSQALVLDSFHAEVETFRPLANYDFTRPPLPWTLNYEQWEWTMTGIEVAAAFAECLQAEKREA